MYRKALAVSPATGGLTRCRNETVRLCHWHIPQTHDLESWRDLRAFDGTATII